MLPHTLGVLKMETITRSFRPSDLILHRVLNPTGDTDLNQWQPGHLLEACGIIPDFFAEACITAQSENPDGVNIEAIADAMDRIYQYGGFQYPLGGAIDSEGVYLSQYAEDEDLSPLVKFIYSADRGTDVFECLVYRSGITALRQWGTDGAKVGRFD